MNRSAISGALGLIAAATSVGAGNLTLDAYLKAFNTGGGDRLGSAVAVCGNTVVIGAPGEDSSAVGVNGDGSNDDANGAGAVYVFVWDPMGWRQQAYLKASNTGRGDAFGSAVAISGDTIVVGAPSEDGSSTGIDGTDNDIARESGAAYVFVRTGEAWNQQAYLKSSNLRGNTFTGTVLGDAFGASVAIRGDTVIVGAPRESGSAQGVNGSGESNSSTGPATYSGAAYLFERDSGAWHESAYLKASNTGMGDYFGGSVAIDRDTVVIGAAQEDSAANGVDGDGGDNPLGADSGAAYVFVRDGAGWVQQAYLKASEIEGGGEFGFSVAVSGHTLVVGARYEHSASTGVGGDSSGSDAFQSGAAYVFVRDGQQWTQEAFLKASNTGSSDQFGHSVAVWDDSLIVGAYRERSGATGIGGDQDDDSVLYAGAAYLFQRGAGGWAQQAYLKPGYSELGDYFGHAVAISKDTLLIGGYGDDSEATGVNAPGSDNGETEAGAAYAYDLNADATIALKISFAGVPGLTDWRIMGSEDPASFTDDLTAASTIIESTPGRYDVIVDLRRRTDHYFVRAER